MKIAGARFAAKANAQLTAKAFGALKSFKGRATALEALAEFLLKRNR